MVVTRQSDCRRGLPAMFAAAVIAATTIIAVSGTARADERTWTVKEVTGTARIEHAGAGWVALKVGDHIDPGSKVETATGARLALARPGDSIDVAANSKFEVPATVDPKAKAPGHILQTLGTLLFKITTRPDHPFGVKTPYLAAVIKGTVFTVSVKGSESELHVTKGAVEVTSVLTSQVVMVRPGMTAAINGAKGGQMQVIGDRRSDSGKAGSTTASANAKAASAAASGAEVIPRAVGPQKINVFQSSGGLVRDLQNGPGNGVGNGNGQGRGADGGNGKAFGNSIANAGGEGLGGARALGSGLGVGINKGLGINNSNASGSGNGLGSGGGNGNGLGLGLGNGGGNGNGNAGGNGNGNGGGNANGHGGGNANGHGGS